MKKILLTKSKHALVDDEDFLYLSQFKWCSSHDYAVTRIVGGNGEQMRMHRLVTKAREGDNVDHIDGNRSNNQKNNLRVCSHSENLYNSKRPIDNTSGYKGITWDKSRNKFLVQLNAKKIHYNLGRFSKLEDAIVAYKEASEKYHGNFARVIKEN